MNVNNIRQTVNNAREFFVDNVTAVVSKTKIVVKPIFNREFVCGFIFGSAGPCFIAKKNPRILSGLPFNPPVAAIAIVSGIIFGMTLMAINACLNPKPKPYARPPEKSYDVINDRLKDWNNETKFQINDNNFGNDWKSWGDKVTDYNSLINYVDDCQYPKLVFYFIKNKYREKIAINAIDMAQKKKNQNVLTPNEVINIINSEEFRALIEKKGW